MFLAFLVVGAYFVFFIEKGSFELFINQNYHPWLGGFFKYYTYSGDGAMMAVVLILFVFYKYRFALVTVFSILFQSVFVSLFKRWLFHGLPRPVKFFGDGVSLHFTQGVDVHSFNTFPSGHTTTAFALASLLVFAFAQRNKTWSMVIFLLALLTGFSRVYLLQHFLIDVYAGAITGYLSVVFGIWITERLERKYGSERFEGRLHFGGK